MARRPRTWAGRRDSPQNAPPAPLYSCVPLAPSRARSKKARKPGGWFAQLFQSSTPAGRRAGTLLAREAVPAPRLAAQRRGPRRLCDLRLGAQGRDAQPRAGRAGTRQPPEDAPPRRQRRRRGRRLRHPGRHPAQDLGRGGSLRRPQSGPCARPRVRGRPRVHRALQRRREGSPRRARDPRSRRLPDPCRAPGRRRFAGAGGHRPRGGAPFLADRRAAPGPQAPRSHHLRPDARAGDGARLPRGVVLGLDLRLQGHGCAERARRVLPRPSGRALRDDRLLRPQPLLHQYLAVVQARAAVHHPRPQRRDQHDRAAPPAGRHAGRLDPARGLRLPGPEQGDRPPGSRGAPLARRGDGDGRAPDRRRDPLAARRAAALLHVPAPDDGPVRPGPGGADRPPRRRVRVLRRRARPAPAVEARDARRLHLQLRARRGGLRGDGLRAQAPRAGREVHGHDRPPDALLAAVRALGDAARGRPAMARAHRGGQGRALRSRARDRRPSGGGRDPRLHLRRPVGAGQGGGQGAGGLRLAARRRQALPADGLERGRADRLARLRRAAGRPVAGAPEPRRLLQGDRRRGDQPGDRPRARDRALLDPRGVRPPAVHSLPGHRHAHDRDRRSR